jgi:molecular chaperone DnaK
VAGPVLGLDFGTTNSLISYVDHEGEVRSFLNVRDGRPHPSTVWYRGGEVVVGRDARAHLEGSQGAITGAFVRSPKRLLFRENFVEVDGTQRDPIDVVAEVLRFLKEDAHDSERGDNSTVVDRVVLTIPVDLDGPGRKRLREAARKAGIRIEQFVHEPLAALYAWLKSMDNFERAIDRFEDQKLLVFDWGGGTLDLTLCVIQDFQLIQLVTTGDNEVGGDYFDELMRNKVRELHAAQYGIDDIQAYETPESKTRLLSECELAKIRLSDSDRSSAIIFVPNYLKIEKGRHLEIEISRDQIDNWTAGLVNRGLAHIDRLLDTQGLSPQEVALCLPTGGMVNVPNVRAGLVKRRSHHI